MGFTSGARSHSKARRPRPHQPSTSRPRSPGGRYCFRAEWPGDLNYTEKLSHTNDTTECFTVKDVSSIATAQKWLPQDTATVTNAGGTAVNGTVEFKLYETADCSGPAVLTFSDNAAPFETTNTTYYTTTTSVSWRATFTPSDPNAVAGSTGTCEVSSLTITN
jgi:hypothetical protein